MAPNPQIHQTPHEANGRKNAMNAPKPQNQDAQCQTTHQSDLVDYVVHQGRLADCADSILLQLLHLHLHQREQLPFVA